MQNLYDHTFTFYFVIYSFGRVVQLQDKTKLLNFESSSRNMQRVISVLLIFQKIASMSKENVTVVPPCINADGATTYLNTVAVRKALHIPDDLPKWTICSDQVTYQQQYSNMRNQYLNILTQKVCPSQDIFLVDEAYHH